MSPHITVVEMMKRHLLKAEDLHPQHRRGHTMANTQLQLFLMSVCILVTQTTKGAFGMITKAPLNRAVYEGATNTTITCEDNDPIIDWVLIPFSYTGSSNIIYLTIEGQLNPAFNALFAVYHPQGTDVFTLVIFNATISWPEGSTFSTAGLYDCSSYMDYSNSHMVIVRSDPICSASLTQSGDVIQLSCTIVYGAYRQYAIDAIMTWSVNGQSIPAEDANFTINSSPTEITASSTILINDNFDATYECGTTFSQPHGQYEGLASNAPDYSKTCTISPTPTTQSTTTTTTTTTSTTTASTTTTELPPCHMYGILHLLSDLLRLNCYTDWIVCSSEINILGIILWPDCRNHCTYQGYSRGTCNPLTNVGCPCIPPGNKKCQCYN